jgi:hypothetical protein
MSCKVGGALTIHGWSESAAIISGTDASCWSS